MLSRFRRYLQHVPLVALSLVGTTLSATDTAGGHGPAVTLFGHALSPAAQFGVKVINFGIFFAVLYFALKGVLSVAFKERTRELEEKLTQAERDKAEGEQQIAELEARMADLQQELDGILAKASAEAEAERERILEGARMEAATVVTQARGEIETRQRQAERELRSLVADLAMEGARTRIAHRLQGEVAQAVMDRSIEQVGGAR